MNSYSLKTSEGENQILDVLFENTYELYINLISWEFDYSCRIDDFISMISRYLIDKADKISPMVVMIAGKFMGIVINHKGNNYRLIIRKIDENEGGVNNMAKLTASQVASKIGMTSYTIKRWYEFYRDLTPEEIENLVKEWDMPKLPEYEIAGSRGDRLWDENDIPMLEAFKNWVPHTKNGIFKKYKKED